MVQAYDVRVQHLDGSVRVELVGELDILATDAMGEAFRGLAFRYDADQVTIECSRLTFIDMSAVGQLVALTNRLAGGRPTLTGAPPFLVRLLRLTELLDRFTIAVATEGETVAAAEEAVSA